MSNPYANALKGHDTDKKPTTKKTGAVDNTNKTVVYETESLLPPKKVFADKKVSFSVKLDKETADRLITLSVKDEFAITSLFEIATRTYLDALKVVADPDAVAKYEELKAKRKTKSK